MAAALELGRRRRGDAAPHAQRRAAVEHERRRRDAAATSPGPIETVDAELVSGRRVLLIDDIITTGSTVSECARTLLEAGCAGVVCASVARPAKD